MACIKNVLFPFDLSEQGMLAVPFVRTIARQCGARITVIGVVSAAWMPSAEMPAKVTVDIDSMKQDLSRRMEEKLGGQFAGIDVHYVTKLGDAAAEIAGYADENGFGLIMMPTHGCGLFRSLLIGSVTAKVLHDVRCPVWTAAHAQEQTAQQEPKVVLCALDGGAKSGELIKWAACFSATLGATLTLVHIVPPMSEPITVASEGQLRKQVCDAAWNEINVLQQSVGVNAPLKVLMGHVGDGVAETAKQWGADLLVVGRGVLTGTLGRLRTHVYGIIQKSPCPVISV